MNELNDPNLKRQISTSIDNSLFIQIKGMAERERRSVSSMAAVLLELAVKERNRKKKNAKEDQD